MICWNYAVLILAVNALSIVHCDDHNMKLRFVTFIFRHGIRSPLTIFKEDPNNDFWTGSLGSLTKLGKNNEYELGKWFRNHYGEFLSPYYNSEEIYIRSTDVTRCLESAQLFAAGLFPPTPNETWNDNIGKQWIPIPVHTVPIWMDPYFFDFPRLYCPRYQQWLYMMQQTPLFQRTYDSHSQLEDVLYSQSQQGYENFTAFVNEGDTLLVEQIYNLTWPSWLSKNEGDEALNLTDVFTWWYTKSQMQIQLAGGAMTKEIMLRMLDVITEMNGNLKVYVNSGHDYTIIDVLRAMEIFNFDYPVFSSAISIELYENEWQQYFIQVLYKNSTNEEPYILKFPNCNDKCPWQFVWDLISPYFVYNINIACRPIRNQRLVMLQQQLNQLYF